MEALRPERSLSYMPLFQVMFIFQNTPRGALELPGIVLNPLQTHSGTAKFDLTLSLMDTDQGLHGALEYNTDLFDPDTISRMLGHFNILIEAIIADPEQRLATIPFLTEAERLQLLVEWNTTQAGYRKDSVIHELFEAQMNGCPMPLQSSLKTSN